jgi:hypothetical protein
MMKKSNALALITIGVFVVFYLSLGIIFEYIMKIPMGFYNVPVVVAFLVALLVATLQTKGISLDKKKITTSYTAVQDKWNTYHHILINYIIDDNFPIVAFTLN